MKPEMRLHKNYKYFNQNALWKPQIYVRFVGGGRVMKSELGGWSQWAEMSRCGIQYAQFIEEIL
jgi:hypothetical protein